MWINIPLHPEVKAGFTTRRGGLSEGSFSSLNLGLNTQDQGEKIEKNFDLLLEALSHRGPVAMTQQVHSARIKIIDQPLREKTVFSAYDGLITNQKNLLLMTFYADCSPIYLYEPHRQILGLIHGGWKGVSKGIIFEALEAMKEHFQVRPEEVYAYVGPRIQRDHYEVSEDFLDHFPQETRCLAALSKKDGKFFYDQGLGIRDQLIKSGIIEAKIELSSYCTYEDKDLFYSYRRQGKGAGRMAAFGKIIGV